MRKAAWIFLVLIAFGLLWAACNSPHDTYDNQVTMENAKAILHMDDDLYTFQSWRPMGHNLIFAILAWIGGESRLPFTIHLASLLGLIFSAGCLYRAALALHGSIVALTTLVILATLRPLLHWAPVGTSDMFALPPFALALLVLTRPSSKGTMWLLILCTLFITSVRPTYLPIIPLMLLASQPSWPRFRKAVAVGLAGCGLYLGIQLTVLVALRGREYGWTSFLTANLGQSVWHLKDSVRDPWGGFFTMLLWGPGPLVPLVGLWALLKSRKESWARMGLVPVVCLVAVHVVLIRAFELRYLLTLGLPLAWGAALALSRAGKLRPWLVALLCVTQGVSLGCEILHHTQSASRPLLARKILDDIREWEPRRGRVFWRGQLFTTLTDEAPDVPGDRSWNIVSLASTGFNMISDLRVINLHPERGMEWASLHPAKGWLESFIAPKLLDGDILIMSAAKTCYMMQNLPAPMSEDELASWDPEQDGDSLVQNPLLVQRVRRARLEPLGENRWKAGDLELRGHPDMTLEGAPPALRALPLKPGLWDLIWVDRLKVLDRKGQSYRLPSIVE
ncbi:MAG: hypothetical protein AB7F75_05035 [Planctomycetota bacterium]